MDRRWRVVATGPWEQPNWQTPLEQAGCEVILGRSFDRFPGDAYSEEELIELLRDADAALVSTRDRITRRVLANLPRLKIVAKATIGVEKIDLDAAAELGILVVNSPAPENFLGIAEATVGQILALVKRLPTAQRILRDGQWKQRSELGSLLRGKTIGIIGLGRVGSNVARRLTGWDVLNTSRGEAIDESALVRAIEERWIAGAALDVYAEEPLPLDSPLRRLDPERVILTPHCIGNNEHSQATGVSMAQENILRALRGERPSYVKNPAALQRWRERFAVLAAT